MSADDSDAKQEYSFKILIVGEPSCGKTCILQRYVKDVFMDEMKTTVGVDFYVKDLQWDPNTIIRLQFWDIAGQERYGHLTPMYYREAVGAFVVYDVTAKWTLDHVPNWKSSLDEYLSSEDYQLPVVLIGNKCDKPHETDAARMEAFKDEIGCIKWLETSAKNNTGIDEAVKALVDEIMKSEVLEQTQPRSDIIDPALPDNHEPQKKGCPCA